VTGDYGGLVAATFLDGLAPPDRQALSTLGTIRRFSRDAALLREGDRGEHALLLRAGRVKIINTSPEGREILIAVRCPGELVGELNALSLRPDTRSASVIALEDVVAQVIPGPTLIEFLLTHPAVAVGLLQQFASRLRESSARHVDAGAYDSLHRVARTLVELAVREGRVVDAGIAVADGLTQEDDAGLVASSRETVTRALAVLRRRNLIATERRRIVVRDLERLRQFAS
jgi:CRP-like cAMP-binding protein